MNVLFESDILYQMTVIVAAHNDRDIVIGSDTLTSVVIDGGKQSDINNSQKIFPINKQAALSLSGYFRDSTKQFIKDFCYHNKGEKDILTLQNNLLNNIAATLALSYRENLQIFLAGYSDSKPHMRYIILEAGKTPSLRVIHGNFVVLGFDGPQERAKDLLVEKSIQTKPKTRQLKSIMEDTLNTCIDDFKDSQDEKLGGPLDIKVLRK